MRVYVYTLSPYSSRSSAFIPVLNRRYTLLCRGGLSVVIFSLLTLNWLTFQIMIGVEINLSCCAENAEVLASLQRAGRIQFLYWRKHFIILRKCFGVHFGDYMGIVNPRTLNKKRAVSYLFCGKETHWWIFLLILSIYFLYSVFTPHYACKLTIERSFYLPKHTFFLVFLILDYFYTPGCISHHRKSRLPWCRLL